MLYEYETIRCAVDGPVFTAKIDNPPANVMTGKLYFELVNLTKQLEEDDAIKVVIFDSADPDFFIAHFDVEALIRVPTDSAAERGHEPTDFHAMCRRVATMSKATIVKMLGRAGGGGNEFASNFDMRFGIRGRTLVNQMEVALGILPGGTGTQTLPQLVGRNRALEIILGCDDIDAETLADWGYLNRVFDSDDALDAFVDRLATRIAHWPAEAISLAKASVNAGSTVPEAQLIEEAFLFQQSLRTTGAQRNMREAMARGAQTREGERRIADLCEEVGHATDEDR